MSIRIVIADDHAVFRSGLRALVEKEPEFEVVGEAGSGQEVLKIIEENPFDVLVLDLSMPGMTGSAVATRVLETHPKSSIVVLTMHDDDRYVRELFKIGVRGYVLKKSTGNELLQAVRAAYRGERYLDPALLDLVIPSFIGKQTSEKHRGRLGLLTDREREVCGLLAQGLSHAKVASKLNISPRTVESHRANLMTKLDLDNRAELVRFAMDNDLLQNW